MAHSNPRTLASGTIRLSLDIETLINNRQGSDIQFKVGDGVNCVTIYAHSAILCCRSRYFAAMLDEEKHWKESSKGVIHKPNISPGTFRDVLYYIYTGKICTKNAESIIDLIAAADEMDLEELSNECQAELIRTVKHLFSEDENEGSIKRIRAPSDEVYKLKWPPIDVALHTHIIPALNLANSHTLSHLSQMLHKTILPRMTIITTSPNTYATFIDEISSETLTQIIASDDLVMREKMVWNLVLDWGCHRTDLTKAAVEARLNNTEDDYEEDDDDDELTGENSNYPSVSTTQLKKLKEMLVPFLPFVRFSLFELEDYTDMIDILNYFLPRRRSSDLQRFFINHNNIRLLDTPRKKSALTIPSVIIVESKTQKLLKEYIFEAGGMGCSSINHLKFELLFRASEHGFLAKTFHQRCNNKGPTLTLVRSSDGHLFGGVNFVDWNYENPSISTSFFHQPPKIAPRNFSKTSTNNFNFLFALADGRHRRDSVIFKYNSLAKLTTIRTFPPPTNFSNAPTLINFSNTPTPMNFSNIIPQGHPSVHGPSFGDSNRRFDLCIGDCANMNENSFSGLPCCYNGSGASSTALAGSEYFTISNYEVFAILNDPFQHLEYM